MDRVHNFLYAEPRDLHQWSPCSLIHDGLYLGSVATFLPGWESQLRTVAPRCVVTVMEPSEYEIFRSQVRLPKNCSQYFVAVDDLEGAEITRAFASVLTPILNHMRRGDTVVVHCRMGISRSAALVAYILWVRGIPGTVERPTLEQIFLYLRSKRPVIRPNPGFLAQLEVLCRHPGSA